VPPGLLHAEVKAGAVWFLLLARVRGWAGGHHPRNATNMRPCWAFPRSTSQLSPYETFGGATVPLMSSMILRRAPNRPVRITEAGRRELAERRS
jgi:hypothetical protein